MPLLGVDIAGILNSALSSSVGSATLVKVSVGTRTPGAISAGTNPIETSYPARGWVQAFQQSDINGTDVRESDRQIVILSRSLPAGVQPTANDKATIVDLDGVAKTFRLNGPVAASGPQGACFICHGRL